MKLKITGGRKLSGELRIHGAKNAVLPIMAATVALNGESIIHDVPDLKDVAVMRDILQSLGVQIKKEGSTLIINAAHANSHKLPDDMVREMRSSIFLMGTVLGRFGKVQAAYPGGCEIGPRPIDLHLKGLRQMGAVITERHGYIEAESIKLIGTEIHLDFPSVGATENIMMAAIFAEGTTVIRNAAKEPEIVDLQNFLNKMGCEIQGGGTDTLRIVGRPPQHSVEYQVIPDRIAAGTYMVGAAITGSEIILRNIVGEHVEPVIAKLREAGVQIRKYKDALAVKGPSRPKAIETLRTLPHPGFPTDMQAQMMALLTIADGTSVITETVFENRFKHADELRRMGANIKIDGRTAIVRGVPALTGALVEAKDLRAGAALVLAGLAAEGTTYVNGIHHIDRGYESIERDLSILGAQIERVE